MQFRNSVVFFGTVLLFLGISALPPSSSFIHLVNLTTSNYSLISDIVNPANLTSEYVVSVECCGDSSREVGRALNVARGAVNVARFDAERGISSPYGFRALFKVDQSKYPVSYYLNSIYDLKGQINLKPAPFISSQPRFACVKPDSARQFKNLNLGYDPWKKCGQQVKSQEPLQAFYAKGTAYIFLCPSFFDQAPAPSGSHCPMVVDNQFIGDKNAFYRKYQMYTLLYELIVFYLGTNALDGGSVPKEVFDWNKCVRFSVLASTRNPTNLLLYTALVQQRCLAAPDPSLPPFAPSSLISLSSSSNSQEGPALADSLNGTQSFPGALTLSNATISDTAVA